MMFQTIKQKLLASEVLTHFLGPGHRHTWSCPFHDDKIPSLSAYGPAIRCFGCQWGGDIFRFIEDYEKVGRGEALRIAADLAGVVLPERSRRSEGHWLPSLAESLVQVRRETRMIERDILRMAKMSAADAWRTAWDLRETEAVWEMVGIGAALDREVELLRRNND